MNCKIVKFERVRNDFLQDVVKQLVQRRIQLKLTQEELNSRLGVADRLVNKWECGLRTPSGFNLYWWADALDCHLIIAANDNRPIHITEKRPCTPANDNGHSQDVDKNDIFSITKKIIGDTT